MLREPCGRFIGNLLHAREIRLRRIRIETGQRRNNEMVALFQCRHHVIENIPARAERMKHDEKIFVFLAEFMHGHVPHRLYDSPSGCSMIGSTATDPSHRPHQDEALCDTRF